MLNTRRIILKVPEKVNMDLIPGNENTFLPFEQFCITIKSSKI